MALLSSVGYASALTLSLIEIYAQSMPTPARVHGLERRKTRRSGPFASSGGRI